MMPLAHLGAEASVQHVDRPHTLDFHTLPAHFTGTTGAETLPPCVRQLGECTDEECTCGARHDDQPAAVGAILNGMVLFLAGACIFIAGVVTGALYFGRVIA